MHRTKLRIAALAAFSAPVVALAGTANASPHHYKWSRSTTGSAGHGYVYKSNGYLKNHWTVSDTKADGDCAFVQMRAVTLNDTPWGEVWSYGKTHRHEVCQRGHSKSGTDSWDIYDSTSPSTKKIELSARVCRDIKHHGDNCSGWWISRTWNR